MNQKLSLAIDTTWTSPTYMFVTMWDVHAFSCLFFWSTICAHVAQHFAATEVGEGMMTFTQSGHTPWKINMVHLQITHLERKMIFQTSMIMFPCESSGVYVF